MSKLDVKNDKAILLFVDDEPSIRQLFLVTFGKFFDVILAEGYQQALKFLESNGGGVSVIISDHYMIDYTGVDLLMKVKERYPEIVRIIATSRPSSNNAIDAINKCSVFSYIAKPWDVGDVKNILYSAIGEHDKNKSQEKIIKESLEVEVTAGATIAHEMRAPLATLKMGLESINQFWPVLLTAYKDGVSNKEGGDEVYNVSNVISSMDVEIDKASMMVDVVLAAAQQKNICSKSFNFHDVQGAIDMSLSRYPFQKKERDKVIVVRCEGFGFVGDLDLFVCVIFNLIKNALYAIAGAGRGGVEIAYFSLEHSNVIEVTDYGTGVAGGDLPYIFDDFYTSKPVGVGVGIGLPFCAKIIKSFGGEIRCESEVGVFTCFTITLPVVMPE